MLSMFKKKPARIERAESIGAAAAFLSSAILSKLFPEKAPIYLTILAILLYVNQAVKEQQIQEAESQAKII